MDTKNTFQSEKMKLISYCDNLVWMAEAIGRVDYKERINTFPCFCDGSEIGTVLEYSWMFGHLNCDGDRKFIAQELKSKNRFKIYDYCLRFNFEEFKNYYNLVLKAAENIGARHANQFINIPPSEFSINTDQGSDLYVAWLRGWNYQKHRNVLRGTSK